MQLINLGIFGLGGGSKLIFSEIECGPMWTVKLIGTIVNPALRAESLREDCFCLFVFFFFYLLFCHIIFYDKTSHLPEVLECESQGKDSVATF